MSSEVTDQTLDDEPGASPELTDISEADEKKLEEIASSWAKALEGDDDDDSEAMSHVDDTDLPLDGDDLIPDRFLIGCVGDMVEARRRWELTKRWRNEKEIDTLLERPQKYFGLIKKYYPHHLHQTNKKGHLLYIEQPGLANFNEIWKCGVTLDDLAEHYVFITEHLWKHTDPRDDGRLHTIIDLKGCKMGALAGDILKLFKKCTGIMQAHYPERTYKVAVINAPWWFQSAFGTVSRFIDPRTKKKILVAGKHFQAELLDEFESANLPKIFGGACETEIGDSEAEKLLWTYVEKLNASHGLSMSPTIAPMDLGKKEEKRKAKEDAKVAKKEKREAYKKEKESKEAARKAEKEQKKAEKADKTAEKPPAKK